MLHLDEFDKLLMIPGPTPVHREILDDLAEPTVSHTSAAIADIIRECQAGIAQVAGTDEGTVFIFGGAGTLAQEAALVNLLSPEDKVLVVSNGFFGDRFVPMAEAHGMGVERLAAQWGRSITPDELENRLAGAAFQAVTITAVETSTGAMAPIAELAAVAKRHGVVVILDAVCALAGVPVSMDQWGVDVVLSGAQKALGVPPGLSILAVSPAALDRRRALGRVGAYYADLLNWERSMTDPQVYFSTHAVNLFYALHRAVRIIGEEGLEQRFERHEVLGRAFRAGMRALGFSSMTDAPWLAPTMSVVSYPRGVSDADFLPALSKRGVVAAGCLGEFKGRGARFGHMGNASQADVLRAVAAVEQALADIGMDVPSGAGVAATQASAMAAGRGAEVSRDPAAPQGEAVTRAP